MNKVYGGTVRHHGKSSLCLSCRHATVATTSRETIIECSELYTVNTRGGVPQPIIECSSYDDKSHPSRHDFEKIGWVINTSKSGEIIGFLSPKEWKKQRRADDDD